MAAVSTKVTSGTTAATAVTTNTAAASATAATATKVQRHFAEKGVLVIKGPPAVHVATSKDLVYVAGADGGIRRFAMGGMPQIDVVGWNQPEESDQVFRKNPEMIGNFVNAMGTAENAFHCARPTLSALNCFGEYLVSGSSRGHVLIWHQGWREWMKVFQCNGKIRSAVGNGGRVLTANLVGATLNTHEKANVQNDDTLNLWEWQSEKLLFSANLHTPTLQAAFGDANTLYSITVDQIQQWDIRTPQAKPTLFHHVVAENDSFENISALHVDGFNLYIGSSMSDGASTNARIKLYDVRNPKTSVRIVAPNSDVMITSMQGVNDLIYTTSWSGFRVWDKGLNLKGQSEQVSTFESMAVGNDNTMYAIAESSTPLGGARNHLYSFALKNDSSDKKQNK